MLGKHHRAKGRRGIGIMLVLAAFLGWLLLPRVQPRRPSLRAPAAGGSGHPSPASRNTSAPGLASYQLFLSLDSPARFRSLEDSSAEEKVALLCAHLAAFIERYRDSISVETLALLERRMELLRPELFPGREVWRSPWMHPARHQRAKSAWRRLSLLDRQLEERFSTAEWIEFSDPTVRFSQLPLMTRTLLLVDEIVFDVAGWHTFYPLQRRWRRLRLVWAALRYQ